eukprot:CAMPEP_0184307912 /NCGR_PEP_ID=MMETSP1049-20130417/16490_1 /TAXON_ID=77928 /ORGANISM="Proteomonas sulcata, Strain CCMP704" /LENGTH=109 /DNA_ID=CAMNT_0026620499 /DNA_START=460 /DNA_END=789 /DNA_ORIENTATION=-
MQALPELLDQDRDLGGSLQCQPSVHDDSVGLVLYTQLPPKEQQAVWLNGGSVSEVDLGGLHHLVVHNHFGIQRRLCSEVEARRVQEDFPVSGLKFGRLFRLIYHDDVRI